MYDNFLNMTLEESENSQENDLVISYDLSDVSPDDFMNTPIDESGSSLEIRVGRKNRNILILSIGKNERCIPHFHFFRSVNDRKKWDGLGGCLRLDKNSYFDHNEANDKLSRKEIKILNDFMLEQCQLRGENPLYEDMSNWDYLCYLWRENNPDYPLNVEDEQKQYYYDTITNFKDGKKSDEE